MRQYFCLAQTALARLQLNFNALALKLVYGNYVVKSVPLPIQTGSGSTQRAVFFLSLFNVQFACLIQLNFRFSDCLRRSPNVVVCHYLHACSCSCSLFNRTFSSCQFLFLWPKYNQMHCSVFARSQCGRW